MTRPVPLLLLALASGGLAAALADETGYVFRSDVSLVRVDAQVLDRANRAITGLYAEDFVLLEGGRPQQIRNFAREEMPADVVLLLDVSGSMRPHVEVVASAAHQAFRVLGDDDRVAIMVFDRATRLRLPFRHSREDVEREFESLLRQETFDGGTDITRALLDAARYIMREGRRDARRAIVILTDDRTERGRNEAAVLRALAEADAVLSALLAPDAMGPGLPRIGRGGSWPGRGPGGPIGGPDIIWGPRGRRPPGPVMTGSRTRSAGTAEIARESGGDSMHVDEAAAFETTLARIRQRYALHFHLPEGVQPGQERNIEVQLAQAARRRHPDAEVRFRRVYLAPGGPVDAEPIVVTGDRELKRRPRVDNVPAAPPPEPEPAPDPRGGWRRVEDASAAEPPSEAPAAEPETHPGGWRRVKPGEEP